MKHFLNIILIVASFVCAVVFIASDPICVGDVIGTPKVEHNVTYMGYSGKYTTLTYTYKNKEEIVFNKCERFIDEEAFESSIHAQRILSQGKVYGETWYSVLAKVIICVIWIAWVIITICTWSCYGEDFKYNDPPDKYNCFKYCAVHNICLLLNNGNYPNTSEFFGYEKVSDTIQS